MNEPGMNPEYKADFIIVAVSMGLSSLIMFLSKRRI